MNWKGTKPTTDMVRQAVCSYLLNKYEFESSFFLDLYAGSGAVSLEFISRGAKQVSSIDYYKKCNTYIKELRSELKISSEIWEIEQVKVLHFLKTNVKSYDVIWADPPYDDLTIKNMVDLVLDSEILAKNGTFVLEHRFGLSFRADRLLESKKYGDTILSFYK